MQNEDTYLWPSVIQQQKTGNLICPTKEEQEVNLSRIIEIEASEQF